MNAAERVRARLASYLDEHGETQGELASRLGGRTQAYISKIVVGKGQPRLKDLDALAAAIGVKASALVADEEEATASESSHDAIRSGIVELLKDLVVLEALSVLGQLDADDRRKAIAHMRELRDRAHIRTRVGNK